MRCLEVTDHWTAQITEGTTESGVGVIWGAGVSQDRQGVLERRLDKFKGVEGRCLKQESGCRVWGSQMGQQRGDPRQKDKVVPIPGGEPCWAGG